MSVNESVVFKVPTIQKLRALYDNYELDASTRENVTPDERIEEKEFLDAILDTKVMKSAMEFLHHKGSKQYDCESSYSIKQIINEKLFMNIYFT